MNSKPRGSHACLLAIHKMIMCVGDSRWRVRKDSDYISKWYTARRVQDVITTLMETEDELRLVKQERDQYRHALSALHLNCHACRGIGSYERFNPDGHIVRSECVSCRRLRIILGLSAFGKDKIVKRRERCHA